MSQNEFTIDGESYPVVQSLESLKLDHKNYRYFHIKRDEDGNVAGFTLSDVVSFTPSNLAGNSTSLFSITASDGLEVPYSLFTSNDFVLIKVRLHPNLRDCELIEVLNVKGVRERFVFSAWYQGWVPISRRGFVVTTVDLMEDYVITEILFSGLDEPVANDDDFEIKR